MRPFLPLIRGLTYDLEYWFIASNLLKQMTNYRSTFVFTSDWNIFSNNICDNLFKDYFIFATITRKLSKIFNTFGWIFTILVVCSRMGFNIIFENSLTTQKTSILKCSYCVSTFHVHFLSKSVSRHHLSPLNEMETKKIIWRSL